jgi:hypothetical protein
MAMPGETMRTPATDAGSVAGADAETPEEADDQSDDQSDEELIELARELFKLAVDREADNRKSFIEDVEFARLGGKHQWPDKIVAQREAAGLPCLTINQMNLFIHQVINDTRQNKPAINVKPVDSGADPDTALVLAGIIRHIENISNADAVYDTAVDNAASGGFGYMRAVIEHTHDDSFDKDIKFKRVHDPLAVYADPYSNEVDSSDWNDCFIADWVPEKQFKKDYPDAKTAMTDFASDATLYRREGEVLKLEWWHRIETKREIVLLSNGWVVGADEFEDEAEVFKAFGVTEKDRRETRSWKVTQYIITGAEILERNEYPGRYIPVVPVYGEEVVTKGKRVFRSLIHDGKDPQRNFNYWRSKASEAAATAQKATWLGPTQAFQGDYADRWDNANSVAWPFLAYEGPTPPQRVNYGGGDPAAMQEAANASNDIRSTIGIFNSALGAPSNETSGRAINARKVESDTATFHFADNLSRGIRWLGNIAVDLIPHVYTPGRIQRILGPDGKERYVTLGESGTGDRLQAAQPGAMPGQPPAPGLPMPPQPVPVQTSTPTPQPGQAQQPDGVPDLARTYDLSVGKYDVVVTAGPGYTTKRQEAADQMMQLIQSFPQVAGVIGDLVAESLDWPGAAEIARRLKLMLPPQLQQDASGAGVPPQLMAKIKQGEQLIQNLMQALKQCQAELQMAKNDNTAEQMKEQTARLSVAVDQFNAETKRLEAETKRGEAIVGALQGSAGVPGAPALHQIPAAPPMQF